MARHKLRERVGNGDDGFAEIIVFHSSGTPQRASACHVAASGGSLGTVSRHLMGSDEKSTKNSRNYRPPAFANLINLPAPDVDQ
jgi:hypothetical protein